MNNAKDAGFSAMDAPRPFFGGKVTSASIEVYFASEHRRLDLCKPGYWKTVLARTYSGELACSRRAKSGIRPDRLAYGSSQPFFSATCVRRRSQSPAGATATRRYSDHDEHLHARSSRCFERSKQQSGSFGAACTGSVSLMLP